MLVYIYDLEVYPNLFVGVFKRPAKNEYKIFTVWFHDDKFLIDDRESIITFLETQPKLVGYNNLKYDSQILEFILDNPNFHPEDLKEYSNRCISSRWADIPEWKLRRQELDVFKIWHYDNKARLTSLKWLEFMYRLKSIKDLPFEHDKKITSKAQVEKVVSYCRHDIVPTEMCYDLSKDKISLRKEMGKVFNLSLMNKSDASMGSSILLEVLSKEMNLNKGDLRNMRTNHDIIEVKDVIFDYYPKELTITNQIKNDHFSKIKMYSTYDVDSNTKIFDFTKVKNLEYNWNGCEVTYAMGGIHGCVPKGIYESTEDVVIKSCDVTSEYPYLIIQNELHPAHLDKDSFLRAYRDGIVYERNKYPKKTHFGMNMTFKLAANSAYGNLKNKHSFLYDPKAATTIVVNGQLSKTMLAEMLTERIPTAQLLMMNTDGLEIMIPRSAVKDYEEICAKWEKITKLNLEHEEYKKLIIDDVNNYIGVFANDTIKRKGRFYIWQDYIDKEEYHKNSSAVIIPEAIHDYFVNGTSVEDTIKSCEDIYHFLIGVKKQRNFQHAIFIADDTRGIDIKKNNDRVLRYYVAKEKPGSNYSSGCLFKIWNDGRITGLQKGCTVKMAQSVRANKIANYPDIDYEWYINEAYKIINQIEEMNEY